MNRKSAARLGVALITISLIAAFSSCSRDSSATNPATQSSAKGGGTGGTGGGGSGKSGGKGGGRGGFSAAGMVMPVGIAEAKTDSFPVFINALGNAAAWNTVTVKSRVDGTLVKLHFTDGQRVKAGDLLAEIDPRPYQVQLEQAQGQLARDQSLLDNARLDLQRYTDAKEAVTQQQIDTARSNVAQYTGAVQIDQSAIDNAKLQLSFCSITSPLDGVTGLRMVDEGNLVQASGANNSIVVVTQDEPVAVFFSIPEDNIPALRRALGTMLRIDAGQASASQELAVDAYDRSNTRALGKGVVVAFDNQIDPTTGTVRIKARFDNAGHALFPNQFVNIRLLVNTLTNVVLVPVTAVQINDTNRFVFVVKTGDAGSTVEQRTVTVGLSDDTNSIITQGLAAGEKVVVDGLDRLQNGSRVIARDANAGAAANAAANAAASGAGTPIAPAQTPAQTTRSGTGAWSGATGKRGPRPQQ